MAKTIILEVTTIVVAVSGFIYVVTSLHWPSCMERGERVNHFLVYASCWSNAIISMMGATAVLKSVGYRLSYQTAVVAGLVLVLHIGTMISLCWERMDPPIAMDLHLGHLIGQERPQEGGCRTLHHVSTMVVFLYTVFGIATSFSISFKHYNLWDRYVTSNTVETPCMSQGYRVSHPLMIKYLALRGKSAQPPSAAEDPESGRSPVSDDEPVTTSSRKRSPRRRQILGTPPVKIVKRRRNVLATGMRVGHPLMMKYPALRGGSAAPTVAPVAQKAPVSIGDDTKESQRRLSAPQRRQGTPPQSPTEDAEP